MTPNLLLNKRNTISLRALFRAAVWLTFSLHAIACTAPAPLNSERIAATFGSYDVRILDATAERRISSLESNEDGRPVTRTLAIVMFEPGVNAAVADLHARIVDGASIGATFREAGWAIDKPLIGIDVAQVPRSSVAMASLMNISLPIAAGLHAYHFDVSKGGMDIRYATIIEVHHPAYLSVTDLERIYGRGTPPSATARFKQDALAAMERLGQRLAP